MWPRLELRPAVPAGLEPSTVAAWAPACRPSGHLQQAPQLEELARTGPQTREKLVSAFHRLAPIAAELSLLDCPLFRVHVDRVVRVCQRAIATSRPA